MLVILKYFEKTIVAILAGLIALVILLATADLGVNLFKDIIFSAPRFVVSIDQLLGIFGQFLIILLGFELLETVKAYLRDDVIHAEVVLIVALIALARKVIVIEATTASGLTLVGLAALILAISGSYWLVIPTLLGTRKSREIKK